MMLDHFRQHLHLGIEIVVLRAGLLDLRNQVLGAGMFDLCLMMNILVTRGLEERGIEDFLLYRRVDAQRPADTPGEIRLLVVGTALLELFEPFLHLTMVGLQQGNRIAGLAAAWLCGPGGFRLRGTGSTGTGSA